MRRKRKRRERRKVTQLTLFSSRLRQEEWMRE